MYRTRRSIDYANEAFLVRSAIPLVISHRQCRRLSFTRS